MNRFPELDIVKSEVFASLIASVVFVAFVFGIFRAAVFAWHTVPVVHAALWPGWAVGLVTAYLGSVIVRALR